MQHRVLSSKQARTLASPLLATTLALLATACSQAAAPPAVTDPPEPASPESTDTELAVALPGGEAVSGTLTISRGSGHGQKITLPVEVTPDGVVVEFPELPPGLWVFRLALFDADGAAIYKGKTVVLTTPRRPVPDSVTVTGCGATVEIKHKASLLLFWNTLDDPASTVDSRIGVDGEIVGTVDFAPVNFGMGVGNFADNMSYVAYDGLFGGQTYRRFSVEFGVAWGDLSKQNYSFFTVQETADWFGSNHFYLGLAQSLGGSGNMLRDYAAIIQFPSGGWAEYVWRTESAESPSHIAISTDLEAAYGEKFKLFLDGQDQGVPAYVFIEVSPEPSFTPPPYVRIGQSVPITPWVLGAYVDNLKVWGYFKTDFSDRSHE